MSWKSSWDSDDRAAFGHGNKSWWEDARGSRGGSGPRKGSGSGSRFHTDLVLGQGKGRNWWERGHRSGKGSGDLQSWDSYPAASGQGGDTRPPEPPAPPPRANSWSRWFKGKGVSASGHGEENKRGGRRDEQNRDAERETQRGDRERSPGRSKKRHNDDNKDKQNKRLERDLSEAREESTKLKQQTRVMADTYKVETTRLYSTAEEAVKKLHSHVMEKDATVAGQALCDALASGDDETANRVMEEWSGNLTASGHGEEWSGNLTVLAETRAFNGMAPLQESKQMASRELLRIEHAENRVPAPEAKHSARTQRAAERARADARSRADVGFSLPSDEKVFRKLWDLQQALSKEAEIRRQPYLVPAGGFKPWKPGDGAATWIRTRGSSNIS